MQQHKRAADTAKSLLNKASHQLMTTDPTRYQSVSSALDRSLDWRVGDRDRNVVLSRPFEPNFAETKGGSLNFQVRPSGPGLRLGDQREITTRAMRDAVGEQFGNEALRWFDCRTEALRGNDNHPSRFGATYGLGFDSTGMSEVNASYEWTPAVAESFPNQVIPLVETAITHLPELRPFFTTVRCGRRSGGQQVTFEVDSDLALDDLGPLMMALGLGHQHPGLRTLAAFVLGARFVLPPKTATLTLLNSRHGPELRLDVNIDALPDAPSQLLPLLRLPMTERPQNLAALDRWMTAMTPQGYFGPGSVTVLSIRVRRDMSARLALFLRPIEFAPGDAIAGISAPSNGSPIVDAVA